MGKTLITGWNTTIAKGYMSRVNAHNQNMGQPDEEFARLNVKGTMELSSLSHANRFLICHGYLLPKVTAELTDEEKREIYYANFSSTYVLCNEIIECNPQAKICVIGSESAYRGSYNSSYADAKHSLHEYVRTKKLTSPFQQLFAISPSIIGDSGMTDRREDKDNLAHKLANSRIKRFLSSGEVATMAMFVLYFQPFISGTVIRMHGENE